MTEPHAFVVIPAHNRVRFTRACLQALFQDDPAALTVAVVDDGSRDGTGEVIAREFPGVVILRGDGDLWWTGAMNRGVGWALARAGAHDVVISLNDDTIPPTGYMAGLLRAHEAAPRALIGSLQVNAVDGRTVIDGGVIVDWFTAKYRTLGRGEQVSLGAAPVPDLRHVDVIGGRGTLIPVAALRSTGPYLERELRHYAADFELSRRALRAGFDLFVDWASPLPVREDETGTHAAVTGGGVSHLLRSFWDIRSANDFRTRWRFAAAACPRWALPTYVPCDYARVVAGSLRRYRTGSSRSGGQQPC